MRHAIPVLLAAAFAAPALAYVPPTEYLVNKISRTRQGTGAIWVKSKVSAVVDGQASDVAFFDVTLYEPRNQTMLCLAVDEGNKVLYAEKVNLAVSQELAESSSSLPASLSGYLLFGENPRDLMNALKKTGIPVHQEPETPPFQFAEEGTKLDPATADPLTFLDRMPKPLIEDTVIRRFNDTIAWVVARDGKSESSRPQLWIEKDTFLPLRLLLSSSEVRFKSFRYAKQHPYPGTLTLLEGDDPVLTAELVKVLTEPELKDRPKITREGYTDLGNEVSGRLRWLIDKYYAEIR